MPRLPDRGRPRAPRGRARPLSSLGVAAVLLAGPLTGAVAASADGAVEPSPTEPAPTASPRAAAETPTVRVLQPSVELPNDVRVLGEGFVPGTRLSLVLGDAGLEETVVVDQDGRFDRWMSTWGQEPGRHAVRVTDRATGESWSAELLLYRPLETRIGTDVPWLGEPVTVLGSHSLEGHRVTVHLPGNGTSVSATAAADGTFAVELDTSGLGPGAHAYSVVDEVTGATTEGGFALTAGEREHPGYSVTVIPGNPLAGTPLAVEGTGFTPGAELTLGVERTGTSVTARTREDGTFSVQVPGDELEPGQHVVVVRDGTGSTLARAVIVVEAGDDGIVPSLTVRPSNPGPGLPIGVSGAGFVPGHEVVVEYESLYGAASARAVVDPAGGFVVELPTDHVMSGELVRVVATDTVTGRTVHAPFRAASDLTVTVTTPEAGVGDDVEILGRGSTSEVTVTVPGTDFAVWPELSEDGRFWAVIPTAGLEAGREYTVVAVNFAGDYAETTFTLAAAPTGPGGTPAEPGAPAAPPSGPGTPAGPGSPAAPPSAPGTPAPSVPPSTEPAASDPLPPEPAAPGPGVPSGISGGGPATSLPVAADRPGPSDPGSPAVPDPPGVGGPATGAVAGGGSGTLPRTGAEVGTALGWALALLTAGAGAVVVARRQDRTARPARGERRQE